MRVPNSISMEGLPLLKLIRKVFSVTNRQLCLNDLAPGQHAKVCALHAKGSMRRRLLDLGLIENTDIQCLGRSPGGDPAAFLIRGAVIAIRSEDCRDILVKML